MAGFHELVCPAGVDSMADPFLWEEGGKHFLLFEEIAVGTARGRLASVELLPDGSRSDMTIVLERPYHLSYPCIIRANRELFLMPESSEAGRVDLFRFRRFPDEVELASTLVEGVALADTTPILVDGRWYFFTTTIEPFMETLLLSSERLEGPWTPHPCNPVTMSVRNCRSAGNLFWKGGRLFRPAQDCSVRYGYAITLNEVTKLTPTEFKERPAGYLSPWEKGLMGTHTWNESAEWQVVDRQRLDRIGASRRGPDSAS